MPPLQTPASPTSGHTDQSPQGTLVNQPLSDEEKQPVRDQQQQNQHVDPSSGPAAQRKITGFAWFIVNVALLSATFLYALDNTVTATVRPAIVETFGHRIDMLPWVSVAYPMAEVGTNPIWATLNKYLNGKVVFLTALFIFEVGSAVIGSAPSISALIVGRALAGFGGSGIYVGTMSMIAGMTTAKEQSLYFNMVGKAWSLGTILGPFVGSAFADSPATWRWAFYINICVAAVVAPACIWIMPSAPPNVSLKVMDVIKAIDHVGAVLFLGSVVSTIMLLGFGGVVYSWGSGQMVGLYVATSLLWIFFALQQKFRLLAPSRIFPVHFFKDPLMIGLWIWTAVAISNMVVTIYTLPLYFQFVLHDSPMRSAIFLLPFLGSIMISSTIGGFLLPRYPWYKLWFIWASFLLVISSSLLTCIAIYTHRGFVCAFQAIQGFGVGPVIQLGYVVARLKRPQAARKDITAFFSCAQMGGLALSLGIATSILINHATNSIAPLLPDVPLDEIQGAINGAGSGLFATLTESVREQVTDAVARSVGVTFYSSLFSSAVGFTVTYFFEYEKLSFGGPSK